MSYRLADLPLFLARVGMPMPGIGTTLRMLITLCDADFIPALPIVPI